MSHVQDKKLEFRFTGYHMLACMAAFFGVIIGVNLFMATMASSSWTGLVVKNSYVASQHFNTKLRDAKEQNMRGWNSKIVFRKGEFKFQLRSKTGKLLPLSNANLFVGRPAFEKNDQTIKLERQTDGNYSTNISLDFGVWDIRISAKVGEQSYRREERIFIDQIGVGRIEQKVSK